MTDYPDDTTIYPETITDLPTLLAANRRMSLTNEALERENFELRQSIKHLRADLDYVQRQTRRLAYIATNVAGRVQEHIKEGRTAD